MFTMADDSSRNLMVCWRSAPVWRQQSGRLPGKRVNVVAMPNGNPLKWPIDGVGLSTYLRRLRIGGSPLVQPKMLARLLNIRLVGV